jgi:succinyl-CoA synthetase alpha subunit
MATRTRGAKVPIFATIKPNLYKDSVALMRLSQRVLEEPGVQRATLLMGTPANKAMLREAELMRADLDAAAPSDLMIVIEADSGAAMDAVKRALTGLLDAAPAPVRHVAVGALTAQSIALAVAHGERAALAQISVPGVYAGAEALKALKQGMHAFVFSDNVPLAHERALKELALRKRLLVMGPDCGTAIIRGVPLGFANVVRKGGIGLVGASGTGLQEVMCRIHAMGQGISHAIGTGSRDVHDAIGGTTMCQAIDLLAADASTHVIGIVSKPPADRVAHKVLQHARRAEKPCVVLFLGDDAAARFWPPHVVPVGTLYDVAAAAVALANGQTFVRDASAEVDRQIVEREARALAPSQRFVRGLYSGGTFCAEAQLLWAALGFRAHSNAPIDATRQNDATEVRDVHRAIDFGADEYTVGRPHPMIDVRTRIERIAMEASDPSVAAVVLDIVLGYGSHPDPAGALAPALANAKAGAARDGRHLPVIVFVCGTEDDPQCLSRQQEALHAAGALVVADSTTAARVAGAIVVEANRARDHRQSPSGAPSGLRGTQVAS